MIQALWLLVVVTLIVLRAWCRLTWRDVDMFIQMLALWHVGEPFLISSTKILLENQRSLRTFSEESMLETEHGNTTGYEYIIWD